MNKRIIWAIAQKDLRAIAADSRVWLGLVLLPVIFGIIIPVVAVSLLRAFPVTSTELLNLLDTFTKASGGVLSEKWQTLPSVNHKLIHLFLDYFSAPMFLMIPVINSMMIASSSFVGEKERRTLETLLFAPIDIKSLFAGKVLASFLPSYVVTVVSFLICGILVDAIAYPMFGYLVFPSWNWVWLVFWVAPLFSIMTILFCAFISARVKTFQQAQSIGGLVVFPILLVTGGQAAGLVLLSPVILAVGGAVLLVLNVFLLFRFARMNERHVLFERQVH